MFLFFLFRTLYSLLIFLRLDFANLPIVLHGEIYMRKSNIINKSKRVTLIAEMGSLLNFSPENGIICHIKPSLKKHVFEISEGGRFSHLVLNWYF